MSRSRCRVAWTDRTAILLLAAMWIIAIVLIDPRGEFPTTDDWAYRDSVRWLVNDGRLKFSDWTAANLLSNIAWGALFAYPSGASYLALRMSTLVAALLGAGALLRLLRLDGASPALAFLGAVCMLFNPLSMALSFSFMSDIGYTAAEILSVLLLAAAARYHVRWKFIAGWGAGLAALLARQIGQAIPLGWAAGMMVAHPGRWRRLPLLALPAIGFVTIQFAFERWLDMNGLKPALFGRNSAGLLSSLIAWPRGSISLAGRLLGHCFFYFGLLAFPLTATVAATSLNGKTRPRLIAAGIGGAATLGFFAFCAWRNVHFPTWSARGNVLTVVGLSADIAGPATPFPILWVLTLLAIGGGIAMLGLLGLLVIDYLKGRRPRSHFDVPAAAGTILLVTLTPILIVQLRFDRYLIPLLPMLIILIAAVARDRPVSDFGLRAGYVSAAVMAVMSIAGMHDAMATKRVQYRAFLDLTARTPADSVDAGWPINATFAFGRLGRIDDPSTWYGSRQFLVDTNEADPDFVTVARYPVVRWLAWGHDETPVLVRRRIHGCGANPLLAPKGTCN